MCGLGNSSNNNSKIILTPSLFMRLLEWSKEDAKDDVALHQVFEKLMAFTDGTNPVGIECYDALVKDANGSSLEGDEVETVEEIPCEDYCCNVEDIECVSPSFCSNVIQSPSGMTLTIDTVDGGVCDGTECCAQPVACEYDNQIADIIKLGQL